MPSLRRWGQASGDALSTLGQDLDKNEQLQMEYGWRNQLRQDQLNANEADKQQRLELAQQARADSEHQFGALHPNLVKNTDGSYREATPTENPTPFVQGISEAKTPEDIQSYLQKFQAQTGTPAYKLEQQTAPGAGPMSPDAQLWQKLSSLANQRNTNVIDQARTNAQATDTDYSSGAPTKSVYGMPIQTGQSPAQAASEAGLKAGSEADARLKDEETLARLQEQLREQGEAKKETARKLAQQAGATKGLPMADIQLGQLADQWDRANGGPANIQPNLGLGGMASAFAHHLVGQAPQWAQSQVNPDVTKYNSLLQQSSVPLATALSGGGQRGAALAQMIERSLPQYGTDAATGRAQIQQLRQTLRYYPLAVQLSEDHPAEDLWGTMQRWEKMAAQVPRDKAGNPLVKSFKDPETGMVIPVGGS